MPRDIPDEPVVVQESQFVCQLRAARELIKDPEHWCQNAFYKTKRGNVIDWNGGDTTLTVPQRAYAMCWQGALIRAGMKQYARCQMDQLFKSVNGVESVSFNDSHSHEAMLYAVDRTIHAAVQRGL